MLLHFKSKSLPCTGLRVRYYNGYIKPILEYCSTVWGTCSSGDLLKLLRLQKMAARIILNVGSDVSSNDLFKKLNGIPLMNKFV